MEYKCTFLPLLKSVSKISQQDGALPHWGSQVRRILGCNISKQVDLDRWSSTLATTIAGYQPPLTSFYRGMLTFWRRTLFQILTHPVFKM